MTTRYRMLSFRVYPHIEAALKEIAACEKRTVSNVVQRAIDSYLAQREHLETLRQNTEDKA